MKKLTAIFLILFFLQIPGIKSQPGNDRVQALRVEFISRRLELSNTESEKFWPVYNEYNDKLQAIRKNLRQNYRKKGTDPTEQEAEDLYRIEMQSRQAEVDVHRQYGDRLKNIIGAKKMVRLRLAEEDFRRELIKTIKDQNE